MKKYIALFSTLVFIVFITPIVLAEIRYKNKNPVWKCLKVPMDKQGNAMSCGSKEAGCSGKGVAGHRVKLTMSGLSPGAKDGAYIVACIGTETGNSICTTGDQTADNTIYGDWKNGQLVTPSTNLADLKKKYSYEFQGLYKTDGITEVKPPSPLTIEPSGDLTKANEWYEWQDYTPVSHRRKWLTLQYADPALAPVGKAGGNQQGRLDFDTSISKCASINWDPYGTLFDAKTLEPIVGAAVTLQVKKDKLFRAMTTDDMLGGDIYNPQTTVEDGKFEYVVPDGDYKLLIAPTFLADLTLVDSNYVKAYSELYTGEVIQQRGIIQHRDIAIPTRNTNNPPKIMNFFYQASPYGTATFDGNVSHPLTKLHIKTAKVSSVNPLEKIPYRTLGEYQADKTGAFRFDVDQSVFEKTSEYTEVIAGLELQKVDLRIPDKDGVRMVTKLEPIPQYLEGYAYDKTGKLLANATVAIMVPNSKAPYWETTTDTKGFYKVTSDHLSSSSYDIKYVAADNTEVTVSPSFFVAQNQAYLVKQHISPWVGKNSDGIVAPTVTSIREKSSFSTNFGKEEQKIPPTPVQPQNSQATAQILTLIVIIVLLTVGVAGIVLYVKKKQQAGPQLM